MPKGVSSKPVFKAYHQHQVTLLPPSLEELIPAGHVVRVVSDAVDRMELDGLLASYAGGGASRYHPRMLLKVLLYGYLDGARSSRRLAKALRENVHYMWLSGNQRPDFRTLNRFRSSHLKRTIAEVFVSLTALLVEAGLVTLCEAFVDGTKIEAQANRYSFVWGKAVAKHKARLETQVRDLLKQIDAENEAENARYGDKDLEEMGEDAQPITFEQLERAAQEMSAKLKANAKDNPSGLKKAVKQIEKDLLPRLKKYEQQQEILGERNSFAKTDKDATFMRMKEDHMKNGQVKPGYNVQITTERQFITNVTVHQNPTDTKTLPPHLEHFRKLYGIDPDIVVADAGYGSAENYRELERRGCEAYVKYNSFDQERKRKRKDSALRVTDFVYDEQADCYTCPEGQCLVRAGSRQRRGEAVRVYEARDCSNCPLKARCSPKYDTRRLFVNSGVEPYRQQARERLNSPPGKEYRSRRLIEAEAVFGQIKHNANFRRFLLRGLDKVKTEFHLVALAHNLKKLWATTAPEPA
ncbi:IS1182 family transposase [bacterium]|nr:IS1182 family transposase [bacterium]